MAPLPPFLPGVETLVIQATNMVVQQGYTLWLFNIAMENGPSIDGLPIKMVIFHGYVSHNQRVIGI
jgi:hypothetical protein